MNNTHTKRHAIRCGSCKNTHPTVDDVRECYANAAYCEAEAEGERRGEFAMSWVHGGGQASDINAAYAMHMGGAR